jgi:glucosamine--fructose-6-phosphate aminotransferase (isomerizing)
MSPRQTDIMTEIAEAPEAVRGQTACLAAPLNALVERCRRTPPRVVVTCARGSSAHAATFGKHLIERHLGIPVAPAAPNIVTVYRQRLRLQDQLFLTISQSGCSDDLIEFTAMARAEGALTASIVNDPNSPLADVSEIVLPMNAGPEFSIAATKSFVATLAALLRLTALWANDPALTGALERLPDRLIAASKIDWGSALGVLSQASNLVTIGRGPTLAIAREAALKLKEVCDLQAEPFSNAEFQHGPMALITTRYPVLLFMATDEGGASLRELAADLRQKGALVLMPDMPQDLRPVSGLALDHPDADAICLIQSFYRFAVRLAERRGVGHEHPRHLQKVTRTR